MTRTTGLPILTRNDSTIPSCHDKMDAPHDSPGNTPEGSLRLNVLGMSSGAALGRVGCALLHYQQKTIEEPLSMSLLQYEEITVPLRTRVSILSLLRSHPNNPQAMVKVHSLLGHVYATALKCFCSNRDISADSIDLIASRADSIPPSVTRHPDPIETSGPSPSLQSWTAVVAAETGITTATVLPKTRKSNPQNDKQLDVPIESLILQHPTKLRVCLSINELATITIVPLPKSDVTDGHVSEECGPGTIFIDYAMRYATSNQLEHDPDGSHAARGEVNNSVVDRFLDTHDYSRTTPPLHISTEMFGQHEAQGIIDECLFLGMSEYDTLATITRITAENIMRQYRRLVATWCPADQKVDELFICGHGARNSCIVDYLEAVLPEDVLTKPLDDIGIPGDAKESVCCAHLGLESVLQHAFLEDRPYESNADPQTTLATTSVVRGKKWDDTCEQVMRFSGGRELPAVQRVVVERKV